MSAPYHGTRKGWAETAKKRLVEDVAREHGLKLKRQGPELVGPCPRCGGTDRFAINTVKQVFNCRQCGGTGDVIALVQHLDGCDFTTACTTLTGEPPPAPSRRARSARILALVDKAVGKENAPAGSARRPERDTAAVAAKAAMDAAMAAAKKITVARYDYVDETGILLFQALRIEFQNPDGTFVTTPDGKRKKSFSQGHYDQDRGWIPNIGGVRRVPYGLPELLRAIAAGSTIFIVEGEAKVDLLRSWGLQATCSPMGAGKWPSGFTAFFAGAGEVIVLPDNDVPGIKRANAVAANLIGTARSVKLLHLLDLPPKGDVIDWAAAGHTVEDLLRLVETEAKPWAAPVEEAAAACEPNGKRPPTADEGVGLDDFYAYMEQHNYLFAPTRAPWPASSVNARVPPQPLLKADGTPVLNDKGEPVVISASAWLDLNRPVEQMTWAPGLPMVIQDRLISDGGWIERNGVAVFNLYRPPALKLGDKTMAGQ
jgi:phage/plasmid primase-like uncharacterized protein